MKTVRSQRLFQQAQCLLPGGVNSPVRSFKWVEGSPLFIAHASGAYLSDLDGNHYIDYVHSWGPLIAGHAHPEVVAAIQQAALRGSSFGAPCPLEIEMAQHLVRRMPHLEKVRLVNSGTEAVMAALRLSRGFTKKNKILKFEGCYHGHVDSLLVKAGSGVLTQSAQKAKQGSGSAPAVEADSQGIPSSFVEHTLLAPYNDLQAAKKMVQQHRHDLAAIIVEPIAGNMGCVLPQPGFLAGLRELCDRHKALLIFDEVMTGFRVHPSGAQGLYQIRPDLTVLGKIIGGGMPVGAYGGRADIMDQVSPQGGVYQAGTLSGNPVAVAAGLATLRLVSSAAAYRSLLRKTERLAHGLLEAARQVGCEVSVPYTCGMLSLFFSKTPVRNLQEAQRSHTARFKVFFHEMLQRGIYLPPSPFEAWFMSLSHEENEIAKTLRAAKDSFLSLKNHERI